MLELAQQLHNLIADKMVTLLIVLFASAYGQYATYRNDALDKTYYYFGEMADYKNATMLCSSVDATLVIIRSQQENDWIMDNLPGSGSFWLGAQPACPPGRLPPTKFVDGSDIEWINWAPHEPESSYRHCMAVGVRRRRRDKWLPVRKSGNWISVWPSSSLKVLCEDVSVPLNRSELANAEAEQVVNANGESNTVASTVLHGLVPLVMLIHLIR